jgi:hypothetical protein
MRRKLVRMMREAKEMKRDRKRTEVMSRMSFHLIYYRMKMG